MSNLHNIKEPVSGRINTWNLIILKQPELYTPYSSHLSALDFSLPFSPPPHRGSGIYMYHEPPNFTLPYLPNVINNIWYSHATLIKAKKLILDKYS